MADSQKTLEKIGLVLDKLVQKVEELDRRVKTLESGAKNESKDLQKNIATMGSSFLGSLGGAIAGMGLYNLLFSDDVEPKDMAHQMGMDEVLSNKLDSIEEKLTSLDDELERLASEVESFDDGISDEDFEQMSLDDYLASEENFDDFDEV